MSKRSIDKVKDLVQEREFKAESFINVVGGLLQEDLETTIVKPGIESDAEDITAATVTLGGTLLTIYSDGSWTSEKL
jgi:hypothetical protein